jgi:Na+-driven multidrug efflux pump
MLGVPLFLMQIGNSILNVILNKRLLIFGGNMAISGMGIVNSVQTILLMPIVGLNQGVQPIVSFNFGAKKYERIKEVEKLAIFIATLIVVAGWVVTRIFPEAIVSLFNRDPELVKTGSYALVTWFWCLPLIGFQILAANFFQAIGRSAVAMTLTLTRQIILLIPAIILFSEAWGLKGILFAAPFADAISTVITGISFIFGMRKLSALKATDSLISAQNFDLL